MGKNIEKYYTFLKKCSTVVVTVHSWAVHCAAWPQANRRKRHSHTYSACPNRWERYSRTSFTLMPREMENSVYRFSSAIL